MNKNTEFYYQNARKLHLPVHYDPHLDLLTISLGKKHYFFLHSVSPLNNYTSGYACKNKYITCILLKNSGFPIPETRVLDH
jgi:hypothetical protein